MPDLEFTGERFVPGKSPDYIEAEHLARYEFALEYVKNRKVLDLGCGEGYGSSMLACVAESVTGVDIDSSAISHASETYKKENLSFRQSSASGLPFEEREFDAVVSFEVIEHIANPDAMLREISRVIKANGTLIISTPNGAVKVASEPNPYHVKEFRLEEFRLLIRESFPESQWDLKICGQFKTGKKYSSFGTAVKNAYLSIKGIIGLTQPLIKKSESKSSDNQDGFSFRTENAHLAEYLIAIVTGRG